MGSVISMEAAVRAGEGCSEHFGGRGEKKRSVCIAREMSRELRVFLLGRVRRKDRLHYCVAREMSS